MATAALVAATVISAAGAAYSGFKQNQIANFNADMAEREADYQARRTKAEEGRHWRRVKKVLGEQKTQFGQAGVALMSGSALDVYSSSVAEAELDAAIIRSGGQAAITGALIQAEGQRSAGDAALVAGATRAGTTLLTGASEAGAFN